MAEPRQGQVVLCEHKGAFTDAEHESGCDGGARIGAAKGGNPSGLMPTSRLASLVPRYRSNTAHQLPRAVNNLYIHRRMCGEYAVDSRAARLAELQMG